MSAYAKHIDSIAEKKINLYLCAMSRLVYISRNYKTIGNGAGKARVDVEDILCSHGAVNLGRPRSLHHNMAIDYMLNLSGIISFMSRVMPGDVVFVQYPVKKYFRLICRWAHLRKASVVSLVHDLGSFRRKRISVPDEIRKLSLSDVVIAANENTVRWLRENGFRKPLTTQVAWDFLSGIRHGGPDPDRLSVAFIGALSPSRNAFLYKLPRRIKLHLYGGGADSTAKLPDGITLHGFGEPDALIENAQGRYGLIWYGPSTSEHLGYIGEYIKYCNPHKLALYMRAGKPVIIWKGSGPASFVEKEGIGLTVDSLDNLDRILDNVSEEQYRTMCANVERVASRMADGDFLLDAISRAHLQLEK